MRKVLFSVCVVLTYRCPGFKKYKASLERKKNSRSRLKGDSLSRLETNTPKEPEIPNGVTSLAAGSSVAAVVALATVEPGLVNPAFDESEEGGTVTVIEARIL